MKVALTKIPDRPARSIASGRRLGSSYEETAEICGVAVGTIKSRVNRARRKLAELLQVEGEGEFGPDAQVAAIVRSSSAAR